MSNINNNNENDITCKKNSYLIIFDDNACNLLKKHILTFLKINGYESNENKLDNFYTLKITKKSQPNWIDFLFHNFQNEKKNNNDKEYIYNDIRMYRIIIYKYDNNMYFLEKNGDIKIEKSLVNYFNENNIDFDTINYDDWKKIVNNDDDNDDKNKNKNKDEIIILHDNIKKYLKNIKNDIKNINNIVKINKIINIDLSENDYNLKNILIKYDNLIQNKKINIDDKLIDYKVNDCKTTTAYKKGDEGIYNKLACEKNNNKYICLDKLIIENIEIGDIYNIDKNIFYHNKKDKDLRVLSSQITNSILMIRDDNTLTNYLNKCKLNDKIDKEKIKKCDYVFGIIQERKNISLKDKLSIGLTCLILDKINIRYYCDCIKFINDVEVNNDNDKKTIKRSISKKIEKDINSDTEDEKKITKVKKNKSTVNK